MDTKTYLNQIAVLNSVIRNKTEELQQLKGMTVSISTTQKEVNVQVTPDKDKLGSAVAEIVDLENDISEMISRALERRRQITTEISNLQNKNQYDVLYKRYVLRKDWNLICVEMGYSFRNVMSIHGKALKSFEKLFGEKYLAQKCT